MAERVEIEVGATTANAVSALSSVGAASVGMADAAVRAVQSALHPFESLALVVSGVEAAISLAERAFRAFIGPMGEAVALAIEYRGEQDGLVRSLQGVDRQLERLGAAFGEIALNGLEASGVVEDLEGWLEDLVDQVLDADTAIGQLVRQGFIAMVDGARFVVQGVGFITEGLVGLVGMANVAREALVEVALTGQRVFLESRLDRLVRMQGAAGSIDTSFGVGGAMDHMAAVVQRAMGSQAGGVGDTHPLQMLDENIAGLQAEIAALDGVIDRQAEARRAAEDTAAANIQGVRDTIAAFDELSAIMDRFIVGLSGDASVNDAPPGGGGSGKRGNAVGGGTDLLHRAGLVGMLFATTPGFEAGLREIAERVDRIQGAIGDLFAGEGGGKGLTPLKDGMDSMVDMMAGSFGSGLDNMLRDLGSFLVAGERGFEAFGEAVRDTFASTLGSIGSGMQQAAISGLISGGSGPLGLFFGLGAMFSLAAGIIGGGGNTSHRGGSAANVSDTLNTIRPEVSSMGPTTVVQMSIGAIYSPEESAIAVDKLRRRGLAMGLAGGIGDD